MKTNQHPKCARSSGRDLYLTASLAPFVAIFVLAGAPGRANADAAPAAAEPKDAALSEIIVTAQKRSERIADVPMSITALTGAQLTRSGVTDITQLGKVVPGFGYQLSAFGAPVFSIRGVGFYDNSISAGPAVTTYVDQAVLPYSVETRGAALDLERLEVLKGPQGTLFGMNSTGGAINYIAAKPTKTFSGGVDVSYGSYSDLNLSGFVSGPITETLTGRIAMQYERADGWQRSQTRPDDVNGAKDFTNGRILLDWKPTSHLTAELALSAWHDGSESQAAQFEGYYPAVPATSVTQFVEDGLLASPVAPHKATAADWDPGQSFKRHDDFYQAALRIDWQLNDDLTLTSLTAYSNFRGQDPLDIDGSAFTNFAVKSHTSFLSSISQELRLSGTAGPVKWMLGGNYQSDIANEYELSYNQGTNNQIGPYLFTALGQISDQDIDTKSVFGSVDYAVTSAITLQGSVRYTSQDRKFHGCVADAGVGPTGVSGAVAFGFLSSIFTDSEVSVAPGACLTLDANTFLPAMAHSQLNQDNVSWRLGAKWKLGPDALIYGNVTKGYKSGSYSLVPAILSSQFAPVTQESVLVYEVGLKQSFLDRRWEADAAFFYDDYRDKQLLGYVLTPVFGTLPELVNIPKSYVYGVELNLTGHPVTGLRLNAGVTYVMSRVEKDPTAPAEPRNPFGVLTSYVGEAFPNTPRWQAVGDAEYRFPIGGKDLQAFVGGTVSYRGRSYAGFGQSPEFRLPDYTLLDLRVGVESPSGHWTGQVWGRNVTNQYYWTNVTHLTDSLARLAGMPATYGVSLSYRY
ncbi:MAG: TonB-dependent receptor [Caulobacteraceae bacterium]|nr:TonB-dependent receptor [Caulobacteraceae bacterium]